MSYAQLPFGYGTGNQNIQQNAMDRAEEAILQAIVAARLTRQQAYAHYQLLLFFIRSSLICFRLQQQQATVQYPVVVQQAPLLVVQNLAPQQYPPASFMQNPSPVHYVQYQYVFKPFDFGVTHSIVT